MRPKPFRHWHLSFKQHIDSENALQHERCNGYFSEQYTEESFARSLHNAIANYWTEVRLAIILTSKE